MIDKFSKNSSLNVLVWVQNNFPSHLDLKDINTYFDSTKVFTSLQKHNIPIPTHHGQGLRIIKGSILSFLNFCKQKEPNSFQSSLLTHLNIDERN
jgi:hypothetical protein